jgi:4-aminobutyrate--pyruvate transaminase
MIPEMIYQAMVDESRKIGTFGHGFTYSGHPTCAAVALKNLELLESRNIVLHVQTISPRFMARLAGLSDHPLVGEARGIGLIGGCELVADKADRLPFDPQKGVGAYCALQCQERGLIVRSLGDAVAFCPPLIITETQIDDMFDIFVEALGATEAWVVKEGLR